jgi:hypothetical protein
MRLLNPTRAHEVCSIKNGTANAAASQDIYR